MKNTKPFLARLPAKLGRQRGASLLEGIAYLGIAALVVLGAVSLLTNAFGSAKGNQTTEETVALRTAVRKLYTGQAYPTDGMVASLITANAIPNTLVKSAGALSNSWAGAVTITGNDAGVFKISYGSVPQDVCMGVVSGANGWNSISNGTVTVTTFPVSVDDAGKICASAANNLTFSAT